MTTSFDRAELSAALAAVMPAVDQRPFNPALGCVRITGSTGRASVVATDLDLTIMRSLDVGGDDLDVVVGAQNLARLVGKLAGETVELSAGGGALSIASGAATASLATVDTAEFPRVDTHPCDDDVPLTAEQLAMLGRIVPFASEDQTRPRLLGVVFDGHEAYATTSFHLGRATFDSDLPAMNIPARLLRAVLGAIDGGAGARLSFDGRRAVVSTETTTWATTVITAEAPQVAQLLDMYATPTTLATCDVSELRKAIALTRSLPADPDVVRFAIDDDGLRVWRRELDVGEVANVVRVELTGDPIEVFVFNPHLMADVLAGVTTDSVTLGFFSPDGRKPLRVSDGDWTSLLMPVHP